jgi:hypothetical protein
VRVRIDLKPGDFLIPRLLRRFIPCFLSASMTKLAVL